MADARSSRPTVEELLAYDLAVCAWMQEGGDGEIPFEDPPALPDHKTPTVEAAGQLALEGIGEAESRARLRLAGFDEAGSGALAGPVVVGCVHFPPSSLLGSGSVRLFDALRGVGDSKQVPPRRREALYDRIVEHAVCGVGASPACEIDRIGIVAASGRAATRALLQLGARVDAGLFDRGLSLHPVEGAGRPVGPETVATATRADGRSLHVAAASILAKVTRDRFMVALAERFPGFGLETHKGYGTLVHREAIDASGASPIHRRTFLHHRPG